MLRGAAITLFALSIATQLDKFFYGGQHTDAALTILVEIRSSFGF